MSLMDTAIRRSGTVSALVLIGLFGGGAGGAMSQDAPTAIRGRVLDEATRVPLEGAIVMLLGGVTGYMTDSLGHFRLDVYPDDLGYRLSVEELGYATIEVSVPASALTDFTTINLPVNPIALEGLEVLVDRFERRRRFFNGTVRTLDQALLMRSAGTAYDAVRRIIPFARPCRPDLTDLCAYRRGGRIRVSICIAEVPAYAGISELDQYDPSELYLVEVFDATQVRVYTRSFVQRAMREGRRLQPLWGCA